MGTAPQGRDRQATARKGAMIRLWKTQASGILGAGAMPPATAKPYAVQGVGKAGFDLKAQFAP